MLIFSSIRISDNKMPRSQKEASETKKPEVDAPKPVPRNKNSGSSPTEHPRDSPPSVQPRADLRPVPAPRREVQSMAINEVGQPKPSRGPPPVPPTRPQSWVPTSQNVPEDQAYAVVNKQTKSIPKSASQNLIDAPLSSEAGQVEKNDPFDTSSVPSQFLNQGPNSLVTPPQRVNRPPPPVPTRQVLSNQDLTSSASSHSNPDKWGSSQSHSGNGSNSPPSPSFSPPEVPSFDSKPGQYSHQGPPSESPPTVPSSVGSPTESPPPPPSESPPPLPSNGPPLEAPPPFPSDGPPLEPPPPLPSNGPPSEPPPPLPADDDEDQFAEFKANFNSFQNSTNEIPKNASPPVTQRLPNNGAVPNRPMPPVPSRGPATGMPPVPRRPANLPPVPPRS